MEWKTIQIDTTNFFFDDITCHAKCHIKWKAIVDLKKALANSEEKFNKLCMYTLSSSFYVIVHDFFLSFGKRNKNGWKIERYS